MDVALLLTDDTERFRPERLFREDTVHEFLAGTDPFLPYRRAAARFSEYDPLQRMLLTDMTVQLPSVYFPKVDRATMAAGIEARVPLLDETMLSRVVSMPSRWKVDGTRRKRLLRDAIRGGIPDRILDAPKTGFGVPVDSWLRGPLLAYTKERILDPAFAATFGFSREILLRTMTEHVEGSHSHGTLIWRVLQLALWNRHPVRPHSPTRPYAENLLER